MKKVIFFDVDGTISTEDTRAIIPQSTIDAINLARKNGHYTFVNTGRTIANVPSNVKEIGFDGYICGCGTYIEHNNKEIFYHSTDKTTCNLIADTIKNSNAIPIFEHKSGLFYSREHEDTPEIAYFRDNFTNKDVKVTAIEDCPDYTFDKFVIFSRADFNKELYTNIVSKYYNIIERGGGIYENVPLAVTKATGIEMILDIIKVDKSNAYAIGDSLNDLPMMKAVPNSIAMGHGKPLHKYVSYITDDVEGNGIWNALKHFDII